MRPKQTTNKHTSDVPAFSQVEVKTQGKVYTPLSMVDDILHQCPTVYDVTTVVCDPSAGAGNFLRQIFNKRRALGAAPDIAFATIRGLELDRDAVDRCKQWFIQEGVTPALVHTNILCGDALTTYKIWVGTIAVVVGNPPYVRSPSIPPEFNLRDNLADTFFEVGMELLAPGGRLVFITQDSFITNETSTLREVLSEYDIRYVGHRLDYSKQYRRHDIAVDIALVVVDKLPPSSDDVIVFKRGEFTLPRSVFTAATKWLIYPPSISGLAKKLKLGHSLSTLVNVRKGNLTANGINIPGSYSSANYTKTPSGTHSVGVVGEQNTGYVIPKHLTPTVWTFQTGSVGAPITNDGPFIAVPYFTSNFRFCLFPAGTLTTPLLYVLTGDEELLKALVVILASDVVAFQIRYHTKSRDTGYEFKASTFDNITIPPLSNATYHQLLSLYDSIATGGSDMVDLNDIVNTAVYALSPEDIQTLDTSYEICFSKRAITNNVDGNNPAITVLAPHHPQG